MSKMGNNVFSHEQGVTNYLIIGYTASGANLTRMLLGLLYGTREVGIVLLTEKGSRHTRMV
jgi:hypothetical protein